MQAFEQKDVTGAYNRTLNSSIISKVQSEVQIRSGELHFILEIKIQLILSRFSQIENFEEFLNLNP